MRTQLVRPRAGRRVGGVCAGVARAYGLDLTLVRVLTVLLVLAGFGSTVIFYIAAWIAMPNEQIGYVPTMYSGPPAGSATAA